MRAGDCIHFRGIQHETCEAGVRLRDVRDVSGGGPARWPCLRTVKLSKVPCATTCDKFRAMTQEEEDAEMAAFKAALAKIDAGRSPCCDAPIDESYAIESGEYKGSGARFCSKCGAMTHRACAGIGDEP